MRLDHITINVSNMEKSMKLYGDILGLRKLDRVDMGDHEIQYYDLENVLLELIEYKYDTNERPGEVTDKNIYRHMALAVENVQETFDKLKESDLCKMLSEPSYCKNLDFDGFLFEDCNGVEVEILRRR